MNKLVCLRVCARARADVRVYVRACVRACARARASTLHMVLYPCADLAMLSGREGMFIASASTEIVRTGDSIPPLRVLSSFSGTLWEPLLIFCEHQLRTARDIRVNTRAANTRLFAQASTSALLSHPSHCCSLSPARARYFLCYLPGLLTLFFVTCSNSLLRRNIMVSRQTAAMHCHSKQNARPCKAAADGKSAGWIPLKLRQSAAEKHRQRALPAVVLE